MSVPHSSAQVANSTAASVVRSVAPADEIGARVPHEMSRTGVDEQALLQRGADELVMRTASGSVALADVLERARAALVRGDGSAALAVLDEAWDGAARTEGGWYYRSGALTILGLPGEAERVLQLALVPRGGSVALHFLQSVVRSALGDAAGARESLDGALARRPADWVLRAWHAVLTARAGDRHGALQQLAELPAADATRPILTWARQAIASSSVDVARAASMAQWDDEMGAPSCALAGGPRSATASASRSADDIARHTSSVPVPTALSVPTAVEVAVRSIGEHLLRGEGEGVRRNVRALLQSLSASGTLDQTVRADQVAALRSVLASVLGVLAAGRGEQRGRGLEASADASGQWRATPPFVPRDGPPLGHDRLPRTAVLNALFRGDLAAASTALQKVAATDGDAVAGALRLVLDGAAEAPRSTATGTQTSPATHRHSNDTSTLRGADTRSFDPTLTPIRIGLALLQESSASAAARTAANADTRVGVAGASFVASEPGLRIDADSGAGASNAARLSHLLDAGSAAAHTAAALGAASLVPAASAQMAAPRAADPRRATTLSESFRSGQRLRALALACMALSFTAMVYGRGVLAIALAGGASWLALRSSTVAEAGRRATREDADR